MLHLRELSQVSVIDDLTVITLGTDGVVPFAFRSTWMRSGHLPSSPQ